MFNTPSALACTSDYPCNPPNGRCDMNISLCVCQKNVDYDFFALSLPSCAMYSWQRQAILFTLIGLDAAVVLWALYVSYNAISTARLLGLMGAGLAATELCKNAILVGQGVLGSAGAFFFVMFGSGISGLALPVLVDVAVTPVMLMAAKRNELRSLRIRLMGVGSLFGVHGAAFWFALVYVWSFAPPFLNVQLGHRLADYEDEFFAQGVSAEDVHNSLQVLAQFNQVFSIYLVTLASLGIVLFVFLVRLILYLIHELQELSLSSSSSNGHQGGNGGGGGGGGSGNGSRESGTDKTKTASKTSPRYKQAPPRTTASVNYYIGTLKYAAWFIIMGGSLGALGVLASGIPYLTIGSFPFAYIVFLAMAIGGILFATALTFFGARKHLSDVKAARERARSAKQAARKSEYAANGRPTVVVKESGGGDATSPTRPSSPESGGGGDGTSRFAFYAKRLSESATGRKKTKKVDHSKGNTSSSKNGGGGGGGGNGKDDAAEVFVDTSTNNGSMSSPLFHPQQHHPADPAVRRAGSIVGGHSLIGGGRGGDDGNSSSKSSGEERGIAVFEPSTPVDRGFDAQLANGKVVGSSSERQRQPPSSPHHQPGGNSAFPVTGNGEGLDAMLIIHKASVASNYAVSSSVNDDKN